MGPAMPLPWPHCGSAATRHSSRWRTMWPSQVSRGLRTRVGAGKDPGVGGGGSGHRSSPLQRRCDLEPVTEPLWAINAMCQALLEALGIQVRTIQMRSRFSWSSPSDGERWAINRVNQIQRVSDGSKCCWKKNQGEMGKAGAERGDGGPTRLVAEEA